MKNIGIISIFMLFPYLASANSSFGNQVVTAITVHDSGHLMVTLEQVSHSESCATDGQKNTVILNPNSPHLKEMYSTAMAAYVSGRNLFGWVNGCKTVNSRSYPIATLVSIR
jgi:predicted transcriptional regulator